jgi:hypothetical protein
MDTFECETCGEETPIEQAGLDEVCDTCFADDYPDLVCYNDNLLTGETCYFSASDRGDLEQHWDTSPNHNGGDE